MLIPYPSEVHGSALVLRPWNEALVRQMAAWSQHGFPYHAFDLGHLRNPAAARTALATAQDESPPHRHFVACEGDAAVGRVSVNLRDEAGLYLWAVHVPPEHEGRGVCRRMLAALMGWLEPQYPGVDFVLSSNTFAEHAHRAYRALGFAVAETRWHYDRELAEFLWRAPARSRLAIATHLRFHAGRWEVRVHVMRRRPGTPMQLGARSIETAEGTSSAATS
jgi:RimJ/RimL family protein N-acetyltransferase